MIRPTRDLLLLSTVAALSAVACSESPQSEESDDAERSTSATEQALFGPRHQDATRIGAGPWVTNSTALAKLVAVSTAGDDDDWYDRRSEAHFDNCFWAEGRQFVIDFRGVAVALARQGDTEGAYRALGFVLHAVQDFYSHSNWVETYASGTLAALDETPSPPPGWFSGTYDNYNDDGPAAYPCSGNPPKTHGEQNKDDVGGLLNDVALIDAAFATGDELRRFIEALRAADPANANSILARLGFVTTNPSTTTSRADYRRTVTPAGGPWGQRGKSVYCQPGTFVAAFRQRVEPDLGRSGDDTGLNAIEFYCKTPANSWVERLNTWDGAWGNWSGWSTCSSGYIVGGSLKVEPEQGGGSGDDTAADGARFKCSNGKTISASNDAPWGSYRAEGTCASGEAVCGAQVVVEPPIGGGLPPDDTALNGIRLHCCRL